MYNYQYSELIRNNRTVSQYSRTGDSWHVVGWHGFCAAHDSGCVPLQWCCGHDISPVVPMTLALWPWHWPCGAYDTGFVVPMTLPVCHDTDPVVPAYCMSGHHTTHVVGTTWGLWSPQGPCRASPGMSKVQCIFSILRRACGGYCRQAIPTLAPLMVCMSLEILVPHNVDPVEY